METSAGGYPGSPSFRVDELMAAGFITTCPPLVKPFYFFLEFTART
jgi:hypothetical protein